MHNEFTRLLFRQINMKMWMRMRPVRYHLVNCRHTHKFKLSPSGIEHLDEETECTSIEYMEKLLCVTVSCICMFCRIVVLWRDWRLFVRWWWMWHYTGRYRRECFFLRFLRCFCFLSFSCDEKPRTRMPLFPIHIHDSTYNTCSRASVPCPNERNALHFIAHETNKGIAEGKPREKRKKKKIKDTVSMWMWIEYNTKYISHTQS